MALSSAIRDSLANSTVSGATYMSLHTADPADTGVNEITGGTPVYARKPITWGAASGGGAVSITNSPVFDIPSGITPTHFGLWTAATGGTYRGGGPLAAPETFTAQGTYTVTRATVSVTS